MLEKREYKLLNRLEGDDDLLHLLECEFDDGAIIGDAIADIGHRESDVDTAYKHAYEIKEDIEEAVFQGLTGRSSDFELDSMFFYGHYMYITQLLYNNLEEVVWNYAVNYLNNEVDSEKIEKLSALSDEDFEYFKEDLELMLDYIDNNNYFENIRKLVDEVIAYYTLN
jgi:hypothetical protein